MRAIPWALAEQARPESIDNDIGYVDAHLLASVKLMPGTLLRTRDRRLQDAAARLGVIRTARPASET